MISFPNTTNQGGKFNNLYDDNGNRVYQTEEALTNFDVSRIKSFNMNLNSTFKKALLNDTSLDISVNSFRVRPRPILNQNFTIFTGEPAETTDGNGGSTTSSASKDNGLLVAGENPFMIPASILSTVNRYNRIYKTPVNNLMNAGAENTEVAEQEQQNTSNADSSNNSSNNNNNDQQNNQQQSTTNSATEETKKSTTPESIEVTGLKTKVVSSIFNPTHVIQVNGLLDNIPMMNMRSGGSNTQMIDIGYAAYLGLDEQWNQQNGSYIDKPKEFNSWEVDVDKDGYVISGNNIPPLYPNHRPDLKYWNYDTGKGLLYTFVKSEKAPSSTGKKSSKPTYEKKYYTEPYNSYEFVKGVLGKEGEQWKVDRTTGNLQVKLDWDPFNSRLIDNSGNCTIRELVRMSHTPNGQLGMSKYKYADFLFCKHIGKVSNNHMITLRRFAHPVGDNIFRFSGKGYLNTEKPGYHGHQENAGMGTLITWFGTDDNKLEDILNYSVKSSWKEFKSKIQEISTDEDNSANGLIGMFANSFNPSYNSLVAKGMAGSNSLWNKMGSSIFGGVINKVTTKLDGSNTGSSGTGINQNSMKKWELMRMSADNNKIYTPQNTIQATHKYEGELTLSHEFTLNFSYRLRALDIMNPKAVMLDLLGNILEVTYNRGHFWGGSRRFIGPPRNSSSIAKANAFIDKQWDKLEGFVMGFANGTLDWKGILGSLSDAVNGAVQAIKGAAEGKGGYANLFMDGAKKLAGKFVSAGASRALLGQLKNQLGRPAVYAMDSLLDGAPVGLWHVTIGNPKNPIAAFGNLILTDTKITHSGPLGFDDFPTELKVSCTLKHGRSRDLSEVARMYTKGAGAFYNALDKNKLSEFFTVSNTSSGREIETEMQNAAYARGLVEQLDSIDAQIADLEAKIKSEKEAADKCKKEVQEAAKQKSEQQKQDYTNSSATTKEAEKDTKSTEKKTTTSTQQQSTSGTTNSSSSSETNTDPEAKKKEMQQHLANVTKYKNQITELRNKKTSAKEELRGKDGKEGFGKYVKDTYSSIYGDTKALADKLQSMTPETADKLYQDITSASSTSPDYYRRGHFIRDQWALRYETLGQDLDTEGRILIDENA